MKKIYQGARTSDGEQIFPGIMPGGEAGQGGWSNWITGNDPGRGAHMTLGFPALKNIVFANPDWDFRTFRFDRVQGFDSDVDFLDATMGPIINNINPDLHAFRANGGKLIQYHGWADPDISPLNSINYYQSVVQFLNRDGHGRAKPRAFIACSWCPECFTATAARAPIRSMRWRAGTVEREGRGSGSHRRDPCNQRGSGSYAPAMPVSAGSAVEGQRQHGSSRQFRLRAAEGPVRSSERGQAEIFILQDCSVPFTPFSRQSVVQALVERAAQPFWSWSRKLLLCGAVRCASYACLALPDFDDGEVVRARHVAQGFEAHEPGVLAIIGGELLQQFRGSRPRNSDTRRHR